MTLVWLRLFTGLFFFINLKASLCMVLSSQHIHLDEKNCIGTIAVRGTAIKVLKLNNKLLAIKGIRHDDIGLNGQKGGYKPL